MDLWSISQVLVKSHFFFRLPFFPTCSSLQGSLKILLCRLFSPVFVLANFNPFGSLSLLLSCYLSGVNSDLCSGTETLQADWKDLVIQWNRAVKLVFTII